MNRLWILSLVLLMGGCASITTGQHQSVSIDTPNCPQATCRLTNKDGTYFVSSTPGTVMVNRVCGKLTVQCSKDGYPDSIMTVSSSVKAMAFGNIIFGGLIGAGVDAATGAACDYPALVPVPMSCGNTSAKPRVKFAIPENVLAAAAKMECSEPEFLARGPAGVDIYSAACKDSKVLMSCDAKECSISEYTTDAGD